MGNYLGTYSPHTQFCSRQNISPGVIGPEYSLWHCWLSYIYHSTDWNIGTLIGFPGTVIKWLRSYLGVWASLLPLESIPASLTCGVPQGLNLYQHPWHVVSRRGWSWGLYYSTLICPLLDKSLKTIRCPIIAILMTPTFTEPSNLMTRIDQMNCWIFQKELNMLKQLLAAMLLSPGTTFLEPPSWWHHMCSGCSQFQI